VTGQEGRFRLLNMDLNRITTSGRSLWGGRVHYRLEWADGKTSSAPVEATQPSAGSREAPVAAWIEGEASATSGLLSSFKLPAVSLRVLDWSTGRPMLLSATPETSLYDIYRGFSSGRTGQSLRER
jgi:hypothetical protein